MNYFIYLCYFIRLYLVPLPHYYQTNDFIIKNRNQQNILNWLIQFIYMEKETSKNITAMNLGIQNKSGGHDLAFFVVFSKSATR